MSLIKKCICALQSSSGVYVTHRECLSGHKWNDINTPFAQTRDAIYQVYINAFVALTTAQIVSIDSNFCYLK